MSVKKTTTKKSPANKSATAKRAKTVSKPAEVSKVDALQSPDPAKEEDTKSPEQPQGEDAKSPEPSKEEEVKPQSKKEVGTLPDKVVEWCRKNGIHSEDDLQKLAGVLETHLDKGFLVQMSDGTRRFEPCANLTPEAIANRNSARRADELVLWNFLLS
jgi:hypothetical protein